MTQKISLNNNLVDAKYASWSSPYKHIMNSATKSKMLVRFSACSYVRLEGVQPNPSTKLYNLLCTTLESKIDSALYLDYFQAQQEVEEEQQDLQ